MTNHTDQNSLVFDELIETHAVRVHRVNNVLRLALGQPETTFTDAIRESTEKGLREMQAHLPGHSNMTEAEILDLSRASHERWCGHWRAQGYTHAGAPGQRDDVNKTHGSLLPFDDLPPSEQAKDRLFVLAGLAVLEDWEHFCEGGFDFGRDESTTDTDPKEPKP